MMEIGNNRRPSPKQLRILRSLGRKGARTAAVADFINDIGSFLPFTRRRYSR